MVIPGSAVLMVGLDFGDSKHAALRTPQTDNSALVGVDPAPHFGHINSSAR